MTVSVGYLAWENKCESTTNSCWKLNQMPPPQIKANSDNQHEEQE